MPTLAGLVWQTRLSRRERRPAAQDTAKKKHCIHSHDGDLVKKQAGNDPLSGFNY